MIKRISICLLGMIALFVVGLVVVYADQIIPFASTQEGGGGTPGGQYLDLQYNNGSGAFGGWGVGSNLSVSNGKLNAALAPAGTNGQLQANKNGALSGVTVGTGLTLLNDTLTATGGGGASVWGTIIGTLSDQQDLWNSLTGKMELVRNAQDGSIPAFNAGGQLKDGSNAYFVGIGSNMLVQLDTASRLPPLDASQLYNLPTAAKGVWGEIAGDITRQTDLMTQFSYKMDDIISPRHMAVPTMNTDGGLNSGTYAYDVGTAPNNLVVLDYLGRLPAVDGSQLINIGSGGSSSKLYSYDNPAGYMQITGPTSGRTMTIPDSDFKVAGTNINNTFTSPQLFKEGVTFGEQGIGAITGSELYYSGMGYYLPDGTGYDGSTVTDGDGTGCIIAPVFATTDNSDYSEKSVVSVSLTYGGSGYQYANNVPTIIQKSSGFNYSGVATVNITNGGDGYSTSLANVPTKTITGTGSGCLITYNVLPDTSSINYVQIVSAGTGYSVGDVIAPLISDPAITTEARFTVASVKEHGDGCTLDYNVAGVGRVSEVSLSSGGSGYSPTADASTVTVYGKGVNCRIGFTTFASGAISPAGSTVTAGGSGYVVGDVITPDVPHEKDAYFTISAVSEVGAIIAVSVNNSGNGYSVGDVLTPTATHIHAATVKVLQVCDFGGILSVAVVSPGYGYKIGDTVSPTLDSIHPAKIKITKIDSSIVASALYDIKAAGNAHIDIKYNESPLEYLPSGTITDINGYTYSITEDKNIVLPPASYVGANIKFIVGADETDLSISPFNKKMYFTGIDGIVHKASSVEGTGMLTGSCVECSTFKAAIGYAWLCKAVGGTWAYTVPPSGAVTSLLMDNAGAGYITDGVNIATTVRSGTGSGLMIDYTINSGSLDTIMITNMGSGYAIGTIVSPVAPCSSQATLIVTNIDETGGIVDAVSIKSGGEDYKVATDMRTNTVTGIGKNCSVNIDAITESQSGTGIISAVSVHFGGFGYVVGDELLVIQAGSARAGTLIVTSISAIKSGAGELTVQDGGSGYQLSTNTIGTLNIDSTGTGCTIKITELGANNAITDVELVDGGSGYKVGDILSPKVSSLGTARLLVVGITPLTGAVSSVRAE